MSYSNERFRRTALITITIGIKSIMKSTATSITPYAISIPTPSMEHSPSYTPEVVQQNTGTLIEKNIPHTIVMPITIQMIQ